VKVSKQQAAEHRAAMVDAAARLFRERGFDGVAVAEITRAAGLTHGGFYGHFASKEALAEEACVHSFAEALELLAERTGVAGDLERYLDTYLSLRHRDGRGDGCPMAALAAEIPRREEGLQDRFAGGVAAYVAALADELCRAGFVAAEARERALLTLAALVGGMALARATAAAAPDLSAEFLATLRRELAREPPETAPRE
jgi:TetR/AcrR family transcriptional repressor of nem operon